MSKELNVPAKCPFCGKLTVENRQHCTKEASVWAVCCQTMVCDCGGTYNPSAAYRLDKSKPGGVDWRKLTTP